MAAIDTTQLQALVADLEEKEQALSDASDSNNVAQAAAQAAIASAAGTQQAQGTAHDALAASVQALVAYVQGLV